MPLAVQNPNMNNEKFNKYAKAPGVLPEGERNGKKSILETVKGTIEIKLFGDIAPLTVSNHIFLANEKFYDNLIFHRREEGFVIQGGDPLGQGFGGPGYKFEDEKMDDARYTFEEMNGNKYLLYKKGYVAMANSGPNTNGSQFFIMLEDNLLPPLYTIFGEVVSGIEVVDQIDIGDKIVKVEIVNE